MAKKIVAILLVVVCLFSVCAVSAGAASHVTIIANGSSYCTVTLTGNKTAKVTIKSECGGKPTVTFKDNKGRYIWGEDKAISANGKRTFKFGSDHSVYRVYVKDSKPRLMQGSWAHFSNPKNCTIK